MQCVFLYDKEQAPFSTAILAETSLRCQAWAIEFPCLCVLILDKWGLFAQWAHLLPVYVVCMWKVGSYLWEPCFTSALLPPRPLFHWVCMVGLGEMRKRCFLWAYSLFGIVNTSALPFPSSRTLSAARIWEASAIGWMTAAAGGTSLSSWVLWGYANAAPCCCSFLGPSPCRISHCRAT